MTQATTTHSVDATAIHDTGLASTVGSDMKTCDETEEALLLQLFGAGPKTWTYEELESNAARVPCRIPLKMLVSALLVSEMRSFKLESHVCGNDCPDFVSILEGITAPAEDTTDGNKLVMRNFTLKELIPYLNPDQHPSVSDNTRCILVGFQDDTNVDRGELVCIDVPYKVLYSRLTKRGLLEVSKRHNLTFPMYWGRMKALEQLLGHVCHDGCRPSRPVFRVEAPNPRRRKHQQLEPDDDLPFKWMPFEYEPGVEYPPGPTTIKDIARCVGAHTEALKPEFIEEFPCAVCGQLHKRFELRPFHKEQYSMDLLSDNSGTRRERRHASEPIQPLEGPVLLPDANHICSGCSTSLAKKRIPKFALANGFWVGQVPPELQDLTLGEKALVSRVRRNRSLVRVSKGHYKMVANVISWPNPVVKVYSALPPPREDLDDVLAIIFTGTEPPTEEDSKRSPLLVRRRKVLAALEWLKLNHTEYEEILIDNNALEGYEEEGIPVVVYHRPVAAEVGNQPGLAKPVYEEEERGTEYGPCPYSVHGLTTTKFSDLTPTKRKDIAIQWLTDGGGALGVGRGSSPLSLYDNPSLYTQMFPWLFPYGLGGVGGEDRRFQMDSHFVITAFNHQQIKRTSSATFLMVKRGNFESVAQSILDINPAVLSSISERMREGQRVVPVTDAEKRCFKLLEQIEQVGGHVDGSLARRKYMRKELWSLVAFQGAPNWYITISPADNRHPLAIYWAGDPEPYKPDIKSSTLRETLIATNAAGGRKRGGFSAYQPPTSGLLNNKVE
ncbi:hypothetical protein CC1G_09683 [Coprinopsis cinerea okayama7|uniref:Uncharacterized protein n=1 Tax=Coprinopsis cinerea (strain Okayama-7 / 130 / ATCC MYA-4618 / FGSC 9003) TaxID=240176 RepID=A8P9I4_COPC7|nr:hypothetical protein CC1G_09683 [Coprinopsis cinerea okayama7\|eukprot:XP_001839780.2 hypothetical protein CC1G_09683 [Coprinopsis cinerea okayama7\